MTLQNKIRELANEVLDYETDMEQLCHKEYLTIEEGIALKAWQAENDAKLKEWEDIKEAEEEEEMEQLIHKGEPLTIEEDIALKAWQAYKEWESMQ